jgi:NAD(P)-dependent dehydrogenase (short-subunit alcohol dehydrogenase family)
MTNDSIAVITGASRGLGRAAAQQLAKSGRHVVATARKVADLESLRTELARDGIEIDCRALDVTDDASVAELQRWLAERHGRVDILVNNAGIAVGRFNASVFDLSLDDLRTTLDTNLYGVLRVTQALLPLMRESRAGRIVNLSSGMGQLSDMGSGAAAYRISKTALNALTRILGVELAGTPIKVNAACPGWCRTDMGGSEAPRTPEEGVDTVVWLATLPDDGPSGGFFRDRQPLAW